MERPVTPDDQSAFSKHLKKFRRKSRFPSPSSTQAATRTPSTPSRTPSRKRVYEDDVTYVDEREEAEDEAEWSPSKRVKVKSGTKTPSPKKASPTKRGIADIEKYSHLNGLTDYMRPGLDIVFCGINPGVKSATDSHHFAHGSNHFWKCLHRSGMTQGIFTPPQEDGLIMDRFSFGLTNLVERPSSESAELTNAECRAAAPRLLAKFVRDRPLFVCFVGMGIFEHFSAAIRARLPRPAKSPKTKTKNVSKNGFCLSPLILTYPPHGGSGTKKAVAEQRTYIVVVPSTSGLVRQYQLPDKVSAFAELNALRVHLVNKGVHPTPKDALVVDAVDWLVVWRAEQDGSGLDLDGLDSAEYLKDLMDRRRLE